MVIADRADKCALCHSGNGWRQFACEHLHVFLLSLCDCTFTNGVYELGDARRIIATALIFYGSYDC